MSTAFRYCETACGSRAREYYALSVPGVTGKTRGHYGPRAARQLGSLMAEPKRLPRSYTTAPPRKRVRQPEPQRRAVTPCRPRARQAYHAKNFPIGLRERLLRHSPPLFPRPPPPTAQSPPKEP